MKGKIFKRVASAMLGLMFMFTAFEMKGVALDEVAADQTMATVMFSNLDNDEIAEGKNLSFHIFAKFVKAADSTATGTTKINKFKVTFVDTNEVFKDTAYSFKRIIPANIDGKAAYDGHKFTYEFALPADQAITFNLGETVDLLEFTGQIANSKEQAVKTGFSITSNTAGTTFALEATAATNAADAPTTLKGCVHEYDTENPVKVTDTEHTLKCKLCGREKTEAHTLITKFIIQPTAEHLGGEQKFCPVCGAVLYRELNRLPGTTPLFMPNGTTNISAYEALNQVVLDIEGYKVIVQDALNELGGKEMVLTAIKAAADSALRKNLASLISENGEVYILELKTKDGTVVKSDNLKNGVRALYQIPAEVEFDKFVEILKKAGVTGDFATKAEKINDKEYVAVWSKTVGPYVLPNGAASSEKEEEKKSTTSTSGKSAKTGDAAGMVCLAASGLLVVAGLYMELMKKKKNA